MAAAPALPPCRVQGLTLIEILVTLTILVALLMTAVPFTIDWGHSAKTLEAKGTLVQAYSHAKALALRNPCNIAVSASTNTAANLQISTDGMTIALAVQAPIGCTYTHGWSASLPSGVTLAIGTASPISPTSGTPINIAIDNRGMPTVATDFVLSRGGTQNEEKGTLH